MDPRETRLFGFGSFHKKFRTIFEFKIKQLSELNTVNESAMFDVKTPMSYYVQCVMT